MSILSSPLPAIHHSSTIHLLGTIFILRCFVNHVFHESAPSAEQFLLDPAVVVACVVFGLLVTFLLFGLFDGWTHSTSPNPFRPPCHARWQVLNLNKEVTNTLITIISIQSVTLLKTKHAPKTNRLLFWLQNKQLITEVLACIHY